MAIVRSRGIYNLRQVLQGQEPIYAPLVPIHEVLIPILPPPPPAPPRIIFYPQREEEKTTLHPTVGIRYN
jgi:hypothetical protein